MPTQFGAQVVLVVCAVLLAAGVLAERYVRWHWPGTASHLRLAVVIDGITCYGVTHMANLNLDQKVVLTLAPVDSKDRPAEITHIVWSASVPGLTPAADGLSATFVPTTDGNVVVSVTADNDNGDPLADSVAFDVAKAVAVKLGLKLGEAQPQ